jgi:DNA-directed RNA polymerase subunit K/omega
VPRKKKKPAKKKTSKKKTTKKKTTKKRTAKKKTTKKKAKATKAKSTEAPKTEEEPEKEEEVILIAKAKRAISHGFIPIPKVWPDHLTKYERSRIIGARALQISMGAPILVEEFERIKNPVEVAEKELEMGFLPLTIRRILPNGEIVDITLMELLANE